MHQLYLHYNYPVQTFINSYAFKSSSSVILMETPQLPFVVSCWKTKESRHELSYIM